MIKHTTNRLTSILGLPAPHTAAVVALPLLLIAAAAVATVSPLHAEDVFSDVPEASGGRLVYSLNVANATNYESTGVPYSVNNSASIAYGSFSRVGYYMLLQPTGGGPSEYAYASFNSSSINYNAANLGVPTLNTGELYNQPVTNMNVVSNVPGVVTGTGITTGTIQFWPSNYGGNPGAGGAFDYADTGPSASAGYGHLEIGNTAAGQTILTLSNWNSGGAANVGIGNSPSGNPDYTFANNAGSFTVKELQVVVNNSSANLTPAPLAPAAVTSLDPTLSGYHLVYQETVPTSPNFANGVPYTQDFHQAPNVQQFDRVAYVMELHNSNTGADQWVSTSFSSHGFATNPGSIGIPTAPSGEVYNQAISDLHVASNVAGVTTGDHISSGTVQFWPSNYSPGPGSQFSYADTGFNGSVGYGHMEIGNTATQSTIFAFNNWNGGGPADIGIGNNPSGQPDWTFSGSAGNWTAENIYVLVQSVPEPSSVVLMTSAGIAGLAFVSRRRTRAK
jgi:sialate O-acetylesterase